MKPFVGGLPTDIDVRQLFEVFGVPFVGVSMTYVDVAVVIKCAPSSTRFKTVTGRWRRQLVREHNLYLSAGRGAFKAMNAAERVGLGSQRVQRGLRSFRRAHVVVAATDRATLSEQERQAADHVLRMSATAIQAARLQAKSKAPLALPPNVVAGDEEKDRDRGA